MGLGFLAPLFLIGIAAIAAPILVHLLNKERAQAVRFPSLMFLRRVPFRSVRRQTIRHPLLLALRCLALVLLAAAFARPVLERTNAAATGPAGRDVVILLDRSYSMGYGDRWDRARAEVRRLVGSLAPADRAGLVLFAERAEAAVAPTTDRAALLAALDGARLLPEVTRLGPALAATRELLARAEHPRREVVLVGDLQRAGWQGGDADRLPPGVALQVVPVGDSATANVGVTGVELAREGEGTSERAVVAARLVNRGGEPVRGRAVTLEVGGRVVGTRTADLPARGAAVVRFEAVAVPPEPARAVVRLAADALPADDGFHFMLARDPALRVLVLERADAPPRRSLYLRRALALGDRPAMRVEVRSLERATAADVDAADAVVLNDAAPTGAVARRIAERARAGLGLVVVAGERSDARRWEAPLAGLLPATIGEVVDRDGARLGAFERAHPVLAPFARPRSGDLAAARIVRHRAATPAAGARVLVRFDDGAPALLERAADSAAGAARAGRVLLWTSTLDDRWNDLALQPVFVPLVHGMVRHAAGWAPDPAWRQVGATLAAGDTAMGVTAPSGAREELAAGSRGLRLAEPGFYELRPRGAVRGAVRTVAVNVDPAEADLAAWDPQELTAALLSRDTAAAARAAAAAAETMTAEERERRQNGWWYLVAAALALLAVETVLANRLSRRAVVAAAR